VFRIGGNTFYDQKSKIPMKIPEFKRSGMGLIAGFRGIPNGFPNQGDESLMERFTQIPRIITGILKKANTVRIYLHIITIADRVNPEGTTIPEGMLNGDWQAGSNLLWPQIPCPPKPYWAILRKCIRDLVGNSNFWIRFLGPPSEAEFQFRFLIPKILVGKFFSNSNVEKS
jgi:hypothetical protein